MPQDHFQRQASILIPRKDNSSAHREFVKTILKELPGEIFKNYASHWQRSRLKTWRRLINNKAHLLGYFLLPTKFKEG